ncbi:hypothetical protein HPB47_024759 [Ixodes persulcatus]|uniref:Uncharacterized protein n=1 Tax=Ixodes persulcatus TaxID=34615 RepID=A0AC60Q3C0_IXOPE|nr:hypothetical protein HPB47_024759 [Ixodes persulcatus]
MRSSCLPPASVPPLTSARMSSFTALHPAADMEERIVDAAIARFAVLPGSPQSAAPRYGSAAALLPGGEAREFSGRFVPNSRPETQNRLLKSAESSRRAKLRWKRPIGEGGGFESRTSLEVPEI